MYWNEKKVDNKLKLIFGDDISKVVIHNKRNAGSFYIVAFSIEESDEELVRNLINNIHDNITLHFYDFFHPQLSDPGAYVTMIKTIEGSICYKLGNHGWQSDINSISYERAIRYMLKNIEYNKSPEQSDTFSLSFRELKPVIDPCVESINYDRLKYTGRTVGEGRVYELNDSYLLIQNETNLFANYKDLLNRDKPKKIVFIGHYLSESIYNDFINGENIDLKDSIDKSIEVRIRKYIR